MRPLHPHMTALCRICKVNAKDGRYSYCRPCNAAKTKLRRDKMDDDEKSRSIRVQKNCTLQLKYGISLDEFERMVAQRNGRCDICQRPPGGGRHKVLHVDHDHRTGKVRGLLCAACNFRLGFIEHELTEKSLDYLRRSECRSKPSEP